MLLLQFFGVLIQLNSILINSFFLSYSWQQKILTENGRTVSFIWRAVNF